MMEGIYFFGEHTRWNLGWSNPNQAGAFIAMLIPWLWGLGAWAAECEDIGGSNCPGLRRNAAAMMVLAAELGLWFLLCKTYSRGALVAVGISGLLLFLPRFTLDRRFKAIGLTVARLVAIGALLFATGFFSRIDPRFVSQDASAGNRLVLWKGGLRMIAEAPWRGWGAGRSGSEFAHWFQPLESHERYAGMVNSYLHVGVEYGLPVLVAVMTVALGIWMISLRFGWGELVSRRAGRSLTRAAAATSGKQALMMAAGSSWLVFLIANVFSTLWIFRNLWWVPAWDCVVILWIACHSRLMCCPRTVGRVLVGASMFSSFAGMVFLMVGRWEPGEVRIEFRPDDGLVVASRGAKNDTMLFYPDATVLGHDWGKEIRRLVAEEEFRDFEVYVPFTGSPRKEFPVNPKMIIACGGRTSDGISALRSFPEAHLILVHPGGKPAIPEGIKGRVSVLLPMLDTRNTARGWKRASNMKGWAIATSAGVGQDIRPVWPGVLKGIR